VQKLSGTGCRHVQPSTVPLANAIAGMAVPHSRTRWHDPQLARGVSAMPGCQPSRNDHGLQEVRATPCRGSGPPV
jgi:hypothetical protein